MGISELVEDMDKDRFFEKRRLNAIHTDNHELKQYAVLTERIKAGDEDAKNDIQKGAVRIEKQVENQKKFFKGEDCDKPVKKKKNFLKQHTGVKPIKTMEKEVDG
jgi:hypothetical protein